MIAGRTAEIQYLNDFYEKEGSHILVVYGQKNIGKTTLMREFARNRPGRYYMVRACSEKEQLNRLYHDWFGQERKPDTMTEKPDSFHALFELMKRSMLSYGKKVIVIDEFQSLVKVSGSFMKELTGFMKEVQKENKVLFILCSSSVSFVENHMIRKLGESAQSIAGLYKLKELPFFVLEQHFTRWSREDCLLAYAVLGGVPGLWTYFDDSLPVMENICRHMVEPQAFLHQEAIRMLEGELREINVYQTLLAAVASGRQKLNELYAHTGYSRAKISVYLKNLMELGLVEKIFSSDSAGRDQAQKGLYRICSRYVDFYYTYLFDCDQALFYESPEEYCNRSVIPDFARFSAGSFREVCRQYLDRESKKGSLPFIFLKNGEWVGKTGHIDIVAKGETDVLLGICCYETEEMPYEVYVRFLESIKTARIEGNYYYLFARKGFDDKIRKEAEKDRRMKLILFKEL